MSDQTNTNTDDADLEAFLSKALLAYRLSDAEGRADLIQRMLLTRIGVLSRGQDLDPEL